MNKPTDKPIFQTNNNKRLQQRSFNERDEKQSKNRPHFESEAKYKKASDKKPFNRSSTETALPQISETTLQTVRGGTVKVLVKTESKGIKEKKTGPLSPRAPEKIKKNRAEEMKVYGEATCLALFAKRPESIVRLWANVETAKKIGEITSFLAQNKKAYHIVDNNELALVSGTEHHGGICLLVKKARTFTLDGYLKAERQQDCLVLLDGVRNPQNIGGIIRTCAFYGIKGVITDKAELLNSAAAMRVAEGGMEYINTLETDDTDNALQKLRRSGYQIVHITNHKQAPLLPKVRLKNKVVFMLSETVSQTLSEQDIQVSLSVSSPLKNGLNVAVNAGTLLSHWYFR